MLRNYLYEYVLIGFATAIVFLTYEVFDLNKFIRDKLLNQISTNVEAIHQNNEYLKELKDRSFNSK